MAYCPYCKIQVAGNTCPRCGRTITPPPPPPPRPQQPQQQPMRTAVPAPPPYRPQYQQPTQRPVTYAPQQPQAQQYYQPAAAQLTPPKKSKKGVIIAVVIVVVILLLASILYLVLPQEDGEEEIPTITYEELMQDMEVSTTGFDFNSYDDGDKLYVTGTLDKIRLADVPPGTFGLKSGPWTILYFESDSITPLNSFAYEGDLRSEYTVNQPAKILIHIEKISIMGIVSEYPKEWMDASMVTEYIEAPNVILVFTETSPGNYTGSVISASDEVLLQDLEIEIYDSSAGYHGWDDGDLTDDNPEEIDVYYGDLFLELNDTNDNDKLDSTDTFMMSYADTGDTITLIDSITDEEIEEYTFT